MKTKQQFINEASLLLSEMNKVNDGCFLLECEKCGECIFMLEGTYDGLYEKYKNGCSLCDNKELILKIGHSGP